MWDWLHLRRRPQRSQNHSENSNYSSNITENWPFSRNFFQQTGVGICDRVLTPHCCPVNVNPPKCLERVPCSDILQGQRVENFSQECWLENHLHRFGSPDSYQTNPVFDYPVVDISFTEQSSVSSMEPDSDDSITGSDDSVEEAYHSGNVMERPRRRLALEELFGEPDDNPSLNSSLDGYRHIDLPPYGDDYPEDPPPTYEEAVGQTDRRSLRSHSSEELAFLW